MEEYRREYLDVLSGLEGDLAGRKAALGYIADSDIWAYGKPAPFSHVPNLVGPADVEFFRSVCATTHRILTKVIRRFLDDADYRALFHFPPEVERLIMLPCDYDELLPLARFDIFLDEATRDFKFCEFNTDGSGAMSRDFEIGNALKLGGAYGEFASRHAVGQFELFDSWVRAFMESYRQCPYAKDVPTVAVTDFRESGVFSDFNRFIAAFERAGFPARFVDVRSFDFDGEHLIDPSDGTVIDAIYRRAVTSEMIQHPGECDALIEAVAARKVCLIGHFRTTVVHSKVVSVLLFDQATRSFLTEEECAFVDAHVPRTYRLRSDGGVDAADVKANKDAWIIKPEDDYGAHGVYPGIEFSEEEWASLVDEHFDAGYVAQEYCLPHRVGIMKATDEPAEPIEAWESMPGLYTYNGNFQGMYCRDGQGGVIAIDRGGLCVSSFTVDCEE